MTVAALAPEVSYLEDGSTLEFPVPFRFAAGTLVAERIDDDGVVTLLAQGSAYSASGGETDAGGTLALLSSVAGRTLRIRRVTPREQATDYATADRFPAETHEAALDRAMLIDQEQDAALADLGGRAIRFRPGQTAAELNKPDFAGRFPVGNGIGDFVPSNGTGADLGLREDLASAIGAELVNHDGELVSEALDRIDARLSPLAGVRSADLQPFVVDSHFALLFGRGWALGESDIGSQKSTTIVGASAASAATIEVADASMLTDRQLLSYQGSDGAWYTVPLHSKSGTTLTLAADLPAAALNGASIGPFYKDYNHPFVFGSNAYADGAIRQVFGADGGFKRQLVHAGRDWLDWHPYPGAAPSAIAAYPTMDYGTPGSDFTFLQAAKVTCSAVDQGVCSEPLWLGPGRHMVTVPVNPAAGGTARRTIEAFVEELYFGTDTFVTGDASRQVSGIDCVHGLRLVFDKSDWSLCRLVVRNKHAGANAFGVGAHKWYRLGERLLPPAAGEVDLFAGDSWIYNGWIQQRYQARCPGVTVLSSGVNGNKIEDLVGRFATDIAPHAPTRIWAQISTNNWAFGTTGTPLGPYETQVRQLAHLCQEIGAQLILWDPTVGSLTNMDGSANATQLPASRHYVSRVEYEPGSVQGDRRQTIRAQSSGVITLKPGERRRLMISDAPVNRSVVLKAFSFFTSLADDPTTGDDSIVFTMGYTGDLDGQTGPTNSGPLDDEQAFALDAAFELPGPKVIDRTADTSTRYWVLVAENTAAASDPYDPATDDRDIVHWAAGAAVAF